MCEWWRQEELGDIKTFILKQVEFLWSKTYGSIWVTFGVNERVKLQRGNKLHHYWLSQYIKAIVLHQRKFEFEFWPIRKFHFIQPSPVPSTILNYCPIRWLLFPFAILNSCPITGWVAILNYCPIRRLLSICHLAFLSNQRRAAPPVA